MPRRDPFQELFQEIHREELDNEQRLDALLVEVSPPTFDYEVLDDSVVEKENQERWEYFSKELLEEENHDS